MNMLNFFKKTKAIAIDLNSENIVIVHNGNVVINEPSVVAIEGNKLLAVGKEAERMEEDHPKMSVFFILCLIMSFATSPQRKT